MSAKVVPIGGATLEEATAPYPERGSAHLRPEHVAYLRARASTNLAYLHRANVRSGVGGELIFCYYDPATGAFLQEFARVAPFPRPTGKKGKKFKQPTGSSNHLYFAPVGDRTDLAAILDDTSIELYLCEGETRALALGAHNLFAVAISGIWSFRAKTADGLSINLTEFDLIKLRNRNVIVCFDHDATSDDAATQKRLALVSLISMLESRGARTWFVQTPMLKKDAKTGIDDLIAANGIKFFLALERHNLAEEEFKEWARVGIHTDRENSERFARLFTDRARYVPGINSWILWEGGRWKFDESNQVFQLGGDLADDWRITARELQDPTDRKRQQAWATACESLQVIRNAVTLAATHPKLVTPTILLDRQPLKFGVANGVIDLETGRLVTPERDWLLTQQVPMEFDAKARCPEWLAFLKRTFRGRPEVVAYLQRVIGYCLTGEMKEQAFFIFYGLLGNNGKGTLVRVLKNLLGPYFVTSELATWTKQIDFRAGGTRNDLIALRGARFVVVHEPDKQHPVDSAMIKRVTGQDDISARANHQAQVTFTPACKLLFVSNHKLKLDSDDPALWRRVHFIEFKERFDGKNKIANLDERFAAELPGILNWAITGCLEWQRHGLAPPSEIIEGTKTYRAESDQLHSFFNDETEAGQAYWESTDTLYVGYEWWCDDQGIKWPLKKLQFTEQLLERGFKPDKGTVDKKRVRGWRGLRLTAETKKRATQRALAKFT